MRELKREGIGTENKQKQKQWERVRVRERDRDKHKTDRESKRDRECVYLCMFVQCAYERKLWMSLELDIIQILLTAFSQKMAATNSSNLTKQYSSEAMKYKFENLKNYFFFADKKLDNFRVWE